MTEKVSVVKQKKTLIHLYFLDHEPGRVSCKDGDGISDPFNKDWAGDQSRTLQGACAGRCLSCELRPQRPRLPQRSRARAVL